MNIESLVLAIGQKNSSAAVVIAKQECKIVFGLIGVVVSEIMVC